MKEGVWIQELLVQVSGKQTLLGLGKKSREKSPPSSPEPQNWLYYHLSMDAKGMGI